MEALKALASMTQVFGITNSCGGSCRALPPAKHRIHAKHSSHLASCWLLNWKTLRLRHWHLLSRHSVNTHNQKKTKSLLFDTVRLDQAPPGPEVFTLMFQSGFFRFHKTNSHLQRETVLFPSQDLVQNQ